MDCKIYCSTCKTISDFNYRFRKLDVYRVQGRPNSGKTHVLNLVPDVLRKKYGYQIVVTLGRYKHQETYTTDEEFLRRDHVFLLKKDGKKLAIGTAGDDCYSIIKNFSFFDIANWNCDFDLYITAMSVGKKNGDDIARLISEIAKCDLHYSKTKNQLCPNDCLIAEQICSDLSKRGLI